MKISRLQWIIIGLCVIGILVVGIATYRSHRLLHAAEQVYVYAYPLVLMDVTEKIMTHNGTYKNQFINVPEFPTENFKHIVRPNVDTLYSFAWLDLAQEPQIVSVPDTGDRYYLVEVLDAWTNVFASLGKRTTGTQAQNFIIVGPGWQGIVPHEFTKIQAPTNMVLLLARTQTYGKKDYAHVHDIQEGYVVISLSNWGKTDTQKLMPIPKDTANQTQQAPVDQVAAMDAQTFYTLFARLLKQNPPAAAADGPMIEKLKQFGFERGKDFEFNKLRADLRKALSNSMKKAFRAIATKKDTLKNVHGWGVMYNIGTYGTDYTTRAMVAYIGIGANLPEDALYPTAFVDAHGNPLNGKNNYRIHFAKGQLPPANAFWSITLYDAQSFLAKNSLNRYSLNDQDPLHFNPDGSLDVYIQHESPGVNKQANWLPAPQGAFNLTMRLYWPKREALDGSWNPPAIEKVM